MADDVFDGNEEQNKKIVARQDRLQERELSDLRKVLSTPEGRRFFWKTITLCRLDDSPFNLNAIAMANLTGRREVGMALMKQLAKLPLELEFQMRREWANDKLVQEQEKKNEGDANAARDRD